MVWGKAKDYALAIYKASKKFPKEELYGLTSQIRRAAVSIASNLAEGTARQTGKDKAHFTTVAYSSLMESVNQLIISDELEYIDKDMYLELRKKAEEISRMLTALRAAQLRAGGS